MSKELVQVFNFNEAPVRTIEKDGGIWFVAADVADVLEFRMASDMTRMLDDDERGTHLVRTADGMRHMAVINEPGLYAILNKSNKETVKPFQKWVNHEVLPAIRKTGHYAARKQSTPTIDATNHFKAFHGIGKLIGLDKNQAALAANAATKKLTGIDPLQLMDVTHLLAPVQEVALTVTEIGKEIGLSAVNLNKKLESDGFQTKRGDKWEPTEKGKPYGRLFDTGKKSGGVPVMQLKWYSSIISQISQ